MVFTTEPEVDAGGSKTDSISNHSHAITHGKPMPNKCINWRSKHTDIKFYKFREVVTREDAQLIYKPTIEMI